MKKLLNMIMILSMIMILILIIVIPTLSLCASCCDGCGGSADQPVLHSSPTEISKLNSAAGYAYSYTLSTFVYDGHRYLIIEGHNYHFQVIQID